MTIKIKVTEAKGSSDETYSELDFLSGLDVSESVKDEIKTDVGQFLVEQVLKTVSGASSPISGEDWPKLSPGYAKFKKSQGAGTKANMELIGDMLDSLKYEDTNDGIKIGFFDEQAAKADGHLKFSGKENNTPQRRFLPAEGQKFDSEIESQVKKIEADHVVDSERISKSDFRDIQSSSALYETLKEYFPSLTKNEIKLAVLRNDIWSELFDELDLLDLL